MYVLYTRQPCQGDGCDGGGDGPGFPKDFGSALLTTYFMLVSDITVCENDVGTPSDLLHSRLYGHGNNCLVYQ
jgi:hypothetical protein